jgi:hypothetical protein
VTLVHIGGVSENQKMERIAELTKEYLLLLVTSSSNNREKGR